MNENVINIRVIAKDMASGVLKGIGTAANALVAPFKLAGNAVTGLFNLLNTLPGILGAAGLVGAFNDSIDAAKQFESAMVTLEIIAPRFGVAADDAKAAAQRLGTELKIGVTPAAEGLQNLLKSGLNLEQAEELLKRFTNEAITGKSPTISLAEAVKNLSFAYATNNSALGNLSGINENFQDIIEKGRKALEKEGIATQNITEDMAKFRGMMDLTNLTLGSSAKFAGTLADTQAQLAVRADELKVKVGQFLAPILNEVLKAFLDLSNNIKPVTDGIMSLVKGIVLFVQTGDAANDLLYNFATSIGLTKEQFEAIASIVETAYNVIKDFFDSGVGQGIPLLGQLRSAAERVFDVFRNLIQPIQQAAASIFPALISAFRTVGQVVVEKFIPTIVDIAATIAEYLEPFLRIIIDILGVVLPPALKVVSSLFEALGNVISWLWENVAKPVFNFLGGAWSLFFGLIQYGWENIIKPALEAFGNFVREKIWPVFEPVANFATSAFEAVKNALSSAFNWIKVNVIFPFANAVDQAQADINKLLNRESEVRGAQDRISAREREARSINNPNVYGPAFAKGGSFVTRGPQWIMVGDNPGGKEHVEVTPLGNGQESTKQSNPISFTINNYGNQLNESMLLAKAAFLINGG